MKFVKKMQTRKNVEKNVKCGHFCSNAHGNAKLMNNLFWHSVVRKSMWCKEDINKGQI